LSFTTRVIHLVCAARRLWLLFSSGWLQS